MGYLKTSYKVISVKKIKETIVNKTYNTRRMGYKKVHNVLYITESTKVPPIP